MNAGGPRIAMVAGEASGDMLAAHLIEALATRLPGARFFGIGGANMRARGFDAWWESERLAVRGYVEVLRHYPGLIALRRQLRERLLAEPPDLFIGVDAPDFNLDLEAGLKQRGLRTAHLVSPSVWAWRGGRMRRIAAAVEHMLCLFPFEEPLYRRAGVAATYVGHPLADVIPEAPDAAAARMALGLPVAGRVVALLPGSRQSELAYLADRFVAAAQLLARQDAKLRFVVPLANESTAAQWRAAAARQNGPDCVLAVGGTRTALAACDVALVASGTATLEAALFKRPMVIAYNMAPLSWALMRRMHYQPWVGLPNILAGEFVVPELLQDDANPANLAQALGNLLSDAVMRERVVARFRALHKDLRLGMADRAAAAIEAAFFGAPARA
ncbi:MAG: lipid-A-disaccharide synthase [Burkholderiales bacterium]